LHRDRIAVPAARSAADDAGNQSRALQGYQCRALGWFPIVLLLTGASNSGSQAPPGSTQDPSRPLVEAVVYTTLRPPNWDIYAFDKPGAAPRKLTDDPALDYNAVFPPDGRWVVFTSDRTGNTDLYALDLQDDRPPIRLTEHHGLDDAASFSPDGRRLAFVSTRDGDADIFVMPFVPGDRTAENRAVNLTRRPGGDFNPAFSDGRRIAFSRQEQLLGSTQRSDIGSFSTEQYGIELYIMDAGGSNVHRLSAPGPGYQVGGFAVPQVSGSPAWSVDGTALFYYRIARDGAEVRRMAPDGSGDISIAPSGLSPAVTPKGRVASFACHDRASRPNRSLGAVTSSRWMRTDPTCAPRAIRTAVASPRISIAAQGGWCAMGRDRQAGQPSSATAARSLRRTREEWSPCRTAR
jgi:hypothetical protein